jgi:hypothetical protein
MSKTKSFQVVLNLEINPEDVSASELKKNIGSALVRCYDEGLFTSNSDANVEDFDFEVTEKKEKK